MRQARALRLLATSAGTDPRSLTPGLDLVLRIPVSHGASVPDGVLLDDHLDRSARERLERDALRALDAWIDAHRTTLRFGAIELAELWRLELFCEVFLPVVRAVDGVRAAVTALAPSRVCADGLDPDLAACLQAVLDPVAVDVTRAGQREHYPSAEAAPSGTHADQPAWRRLVRGLLVGLGLPTLGRGEVAVIPYGPTTTLLDRLDRPLLYGPLPPRDPRAAARALRAGGLIGLPGGAARAAASRRLRDALARCRVGGPPPVHEPVVDPLLHARALRCLADRATLTVALARSLPRAIARTQPRGVVVPFDQEPVAKVLVRAAQARSVPVLAVQHGYEPRKAFHPGECSDAVAQWSHWDLEALPAPERARARRVGNPSAGTPVAPSSPTRTGHVVILAEHDARQSGHLDRRITARHLQAALDGLRRAGTARQITLRPHPIDDPTDFRRLADVLGGALTVDAETPILELLGSAELCVGAISTAALQTALTGTRLVMLVATETDCLPPLDGSGEVLRARTAEELAQLVPVALAAPAPPGRRELLEALGHGAPDPAGAVLAWVDELASARGL